MKRKLLLSALALYSSAALAQINLNDAINKARNTVNTVTSTTAKGKGLSNDEVVKGLKEALTIGSQKSADVASKVDGYYKNPSIKIPFPTEAQTMEQRLRAMGMGAQVDKFVMALNRAAEDAGKSAAPVFANSVKNMSIGDGMKILNGGDNAATTYLKSTTTTELTAKFKPIIEQSLQKVQIAQYWAPLVNAYNKIPMVEKKNPDLNAYVTQKALDGLFLLVSQEELKIRKDPAARVTDILKKVFAGK